MTITQAPLPEGVDAWLAVLQAHALVSDRLERALEQQAGLSHAGLEVLIRLAADEAGQMPMHSLAKGLVLSNSGVTRLIDRMVSAGLVERSACASDRRVVYAAITREGRRALARALPVHAQAVDEAFSTHLDAAQRRAIQQILGTVISANGGSPLPCQETRKVSPADGQKSGSRKPAGKQSGRRG